MLFLYSTARPPNPRQPGQTSVAEVKWSNLHMELIVAEDEAQAKKCKVVGLPVKDMTPAMVAIEDKDANKQRKVLQED